MRNYQKEPVTLGKVDVAVARAIESAQWANQQDDANALALLQSFLKSSNVKSLLYVHLVSEQPQKSKQTEEGFVTLGQALDIGTIAELYAHAFHGGNPGKVISSTFKGMSNRSSYVYLLNSNTSKPITLYVRNCRGALRGEVNEDNFTIQRNVPEPHPEPSGITRFFKKVWNTL